MTAPAAQPLMPDFVKPHAFQAHEESLDFAFWLSFVQGATLSKFTMVAFAGGILVSGCTSEGQYQSEVLTPAMVLQTDTTSGEMRVCIVERAIRVAHSYLDQVANPALLLERPRTGNLAANELDEEMLRREQIILEREAAAEQDRSPAERQSRDRRQSAARIRANELVECTPWQAITPS